MAPRSFLPFIVFRILLVFVLVSLFSFAALDQPLINHVYHAMVSLQRASVNYLHFLINIYEPDSLILVGKSYFFSFILLAAAIGIGSTLGVLLGFVAGLRPNTLLSNIASSFSFIGMLTPSFLLALLGLVVFIRYISPAVGIRFVVLSPSADIFELRRLLPPAIVLSVRPMAFMAQITISALQDVVNANYVRSAYAKGLFTRTVIIRHILPNIAQPVLTGLSSSFLFTLSSLLVVELLFSWYGLGWRLVDAVQDKDAQMTSYLLTTIGVTLVLINTGINLAIRRFDSRVGDI